MFPEKKFFLPTGERVTEWEALRAVLRTLQADRLHLDEKIEVLERRMLTAEGRPK